MTGVGAQSFHARLAERPQLIGVVHLPALPGAPSSALTHEAIEARAVADARAYAEGGADALIIENYGDAPFAKGAVEPIVLTLMTRTTLAVRDAVSLPIGINVLRNDARGALAVAAAAGGVFVRVNVLAGAVATDQGVIEGRAAELLRERRRIAAAVSIVADVDVKHGTAMWGESIAERAVDLTERAGADALIVTGSATGSAASRDDIERVLGVSSGVPVLVGSGVTADNAAALLPGTRGVIVGTSVKESGDIARPVDASRVAALVAACRSAWGD